MRFVSWSRYILLAIITSVIPWIRSTAPDNKIMTFVMNSCRKCNASPGWLAFLINKACREYPSYFFHFYTGTRAAAQNSLPSSYYRSWIDYLTDCRSRVNQLRYIPCINRSTERSIDRSHGCVRESWYWHAIRLFQNRFSNVFFEILIYWFVNRINKMMKIRIFWVLVFIVTGDVQMLWSELTLTLYLGRRIIVQLLLVTKIKKTKNTLELYNCRTYICT